MAYKHLLLAKTNKIIYSAKHSLVQGQTCGIPSENQIFLQLSASLAC